MKFLFAERSKDVGIRRTVSRSKQKKKRWVRYIYMNISFYLNWERNKIGEANAYVYATNCNLIWFRNLVINRALPVNHAEGLQALTSLFTSSLQKSECRLKSKNAIMPLRGIERTWKRSPILSPGLSYLLQLCRPLRAYRLHPLYNTVQLHQKSRRVWTKNFFEFRTKLTGLCVCSHLDIFWLTYTHDPVFNKFDYWLLLTTWISISGTYAVLKRRKRRRRRRM